MRRLLAGTIAFLAVAALAATLLSMIHTDLWWIQALAFPRLAILIATGIVAIAGALVIRARWGLAVAAVLALVAALQTWLIYPYVFFAPREVADASGRGPAFERSCFTALGLNVYQHNRDYASTRRLIARIKPDILLLMETDDAWVAALHDEIAAYPARTLRPLDNTYGLVFASRLPVRAVRIADITDRATPTVYARLTTRSGQAFDYIGLHPRPPVPGQDTGQRDRKIARAALAIAGDRLPEMAMGDFNAVAWSRTVGAFRKAGGYLDPRIGRGVFATFPAKAAPVGWPLDQMFVSPGFTFRSLRVLQDVGSDHRPLLARLCLSGAPARSVNAAPGGGGAALHTMRHAAAGAAGDGHGTGR